MNTPLLPSIKDLRAESVRLKKSEGIKTNHAQLLTATKYGFRDWRSVVKYYSERLLVSLPRPTKVSSVDPLLFTDPNFSLAKNDILLVIGTAGSGKTLCLREVARQALQQGFQVIQIGYYTESDPRERIQYKLSEHVNFHHFNADMDFGKASGSFDEQQALKVILESESTLVILDEIDNLDPSQLQKLFHQNCIFAVAAQNVKQVEKLRIDRLAVNTNPLLYLGASPSLDLRPKHLNPSCGISDKIFDAATIPFAELLNRSKSGVWAQDGQFVLVPSGKDLVNALAQNINA